MKQKKCFTFPVNNVSLVITTFQTLSINWDTVKKKRELFPRLKPMLTSSVALPPHIAELWLSNIKLIPFRDTWYWFATRRRTTNARVSISLLTEVKRSLRIDSPESNCCSFGTLLQLQSSKISFEYLLLQPRSVLWWDPATINGGAFDSHHTPSYTSEPIHTRSLGEV